MPSSRQQPLPKDDLIRLTDEYNKIDAEEQAQLKEAADVFSRAEAAINGKRSLVLHNAPKNPVVEVAPPLNDDPHVHFSNLVMEEDPEEEGGDDVVTNEVEPNASTTYANQPNQGISAPSSTVLLDTIRRRPFAYVSLALAHQVLVRKESAGPTLSAAEYERLDLELSYEQFCAASHVLCCAIYPYDHATAKLFKKYFDNIKAWYSPPLWACLRVYDMRVRLMHLGDSCIDLLGIDKRLLGTCLIEDADQALHHFGSRAEIEDYFDHLDLHDDADWPEEAEYAPAGNLNASQPSRVVDREEDPGTDTDVSDLVDFLDEIYSGSSSMVGELVNAGVKDKASLVELCMIGGTALEEFFAELDGTAFTKVMLRTSLRRRFST